ANKPLRFDFNKPLRKIQTWPPRYRYTKAPRRNRPLCVDRTSWNPSLSAPSLLSNINSGKDRSERPWGRTCTCPNKNLRRKQTKNVFRFPLHLDREFQGTDGCFKHFGAGAGLVSSPLLCRSEERESAGGICSTSPTPRPPPLTPGPAVTPRAEGVACDPRERRARCVLGLRGEVTPAGRRGGRRMRALRVSQALVRSFSSTSRNRFENRVAEKQKIFQADNDLPVHLKGGATDNILYRLTMGLCLGGTVYSLYCLGRASFPHKK
uniref:Cytochrome c oxidase subunit 7A1, mitochondrial n=2 Tax=Suricata suricatta TaxID=37032 RepID=A0A673V1B9_SURSU